MSAYNDGGYDPSTYQVPICDGNPETGANRGYPHVQLCPPHGLLGFGWDKCLHCGAVYQFMQPEITEWPF